MSLAFTIWAHIQWIKVLLFQLYLLSLAIKSDRIKQANYEFHTHKLFVLASYELKNLACGGKKNPFFSLIIKLVCRYGLELHIVHLSSKGDIAVIAIVYKYGQPDRFLSRVFEWFPLHFFLWLHHIVYYVLCMQMPTCMYDDLYSTQPQLDKL